MRKGRRLKKEEEAAAEEEHQEVEHQEKAQEEGLAKGISRDLQDATQNQSRRTKGEGLGDHR